MVSVLAKSGRKPTIVPLNDQNIIKDDIANGMSYRQTIADLERRTGHKYWLEKISEIANSPVLAGVKPIVMKPTKGMRPSKPRISKYTSTKAITGNPSNDFADVTGGSLPSSEEFITDFYGPLSLESPVDLPSPVPVSIFDHPLETYLGRVKYSLEQKANNAMWAAADAITDNWMGISNHAKPAASKSEIEELVKRTMKLLADNQKGTSKPETGPASPESPTKPNALLEENGLQDLKSGHEELGTDKDVKSPLAPTNPADKSNETGPPDEPDGQRTLPPTVQLPPGTTEGAAGLNEENKWVDDEIMTTEPPAAPSDSTPNADVVNGSKSKTQELPITTRSKAEDLSRLDENAGVLTSQPPTVIPLTPPPPEISSVSADLKSGESQLLNGSSNQQTANHSIQPSIPQDIQPVQPMTTQNPSTTVAPNPMDASKPESSFRQHEAGGNVANDDEDPLLNSVLIAGVAAGVGIGVVEPVTRWVSSNFTSAPAVGQQFQNVAVPDQSQPSEAPTLYSVPVQSNQTSSQGYSRINNPKATAFF